MPMNIRKILCPVDFSETSDLALLYAISLARAFNAELDVLHVVAPPVTSLPGEHFLGDFVQADMDALASACRERVDRLLAEAPCTEHIAVTPLVVCGIPYLEIIRVAGESQADLLVMGTHGRSGIEHLLIGSVAERVVRKAPCPVLTVKKSQATDAAARPKD
jgi:nucleotide-binding universal stress UspA family protein